MKTSKNLDRVQFTLPFPDEEVYRNYRYSAFVTNLKSSAELVWELYRMRADCENRIKELEYDFSLLKISG